MRNCSWKLGKTKKIVVEGEGGKKVEGEVVERGEMEGEGENDWLYFMRVVSLLPFCFLILLLPSAILHSVIWEKKLNQEVYHNP